MARRIKIGNKYIGDGEKVAIQSMLNAPSTDIEGNIKQAIALENAGCDILRVAVPDMKAVELVTEIKKNIAIPLVADIHFDYKLALASVKAGIDKIRINPGNIGSDERVKAVVDACKENTVPIRIGVNSGSLKKEILQKHGGPTPEAMCESAMEHVKILEKFDFYDTAISIKTSNVSSMIKGYRLLNEICDYPLHLGVTEAGSERMGTIKSAVGIGSLLADGIGDTIRVSLTADPVSEIAAAKDILKAVGLSSSVDIISCPTCGRTRIDIIGLAAQIEKICEPINKKLKVAVMGCVVNGPGEAREADIGIAGGIDEGLIFKKGEIIKKVPQNMLISEFEKELKKLI